MYCCFFVNLRRYISLLKFTKKSNSMCRYIITINAQAQAITGSYSTSCELLNFVNKPKFTLDFSLYKSLVSATISSPHDIVFVFEIISSFTKTRYLSRSVFISAQ